MRLSGDPPSKLQKAHTMKAAPSLFSLVFCGTLFCAQSSQAQLPPYAPEAEGAAPMAPPTQVSEIDPFLPPPGMVTAPECLLESLGFFGHHGFVYSAQNCFDLASACYKHCYFEDAIALMTHAIAQDPQARFYYLRGMAQMQAGFYHDAIESADGVWRAQAAGLANGLAVVRERFNGPSAVNFRQLLLLRAPQERGDG